MPHCNSSTDVSLVILAAGLGRRFGGNKPLAGIGDSGKPLMYFSIMDAFQAGIRRLVIVINPAMESAFATRFLPGLPAELEVSLIHQNSADPPVPMMAAREKPWGTGHALWCARNAVPGPMVVINADDYYGRNTLVQLVRHFEHSNDWAMAGYPLAKTLSRSGAVNRGLCDVRSGYLAAIGECHSIREEDGLLLGESAGETVTLAPATPVSMNIWCFDTRVFDCLERGLENFLAVHGSDGEAEFYLPDMVAQALGESMRIQVYQSSDDWFGVTHREDLDQLASLAAAFTDHDC